jgi:dephospho-CoA kinase
MFQVGVTGGIGSGKTLVCQVLEKLGAAVYRADPSARRLMEADRELKGRIIDIFGEEAYLGGTLNSKFIAERVFGNRDLLQKLNDIVHPAVRRDYLGWVSRQTGVPYVVEEAAILFESGGDRLMDLTVLVFAPEPLRISRVMKRDGVGESAVRKRMMHQMSEEEKREKADRVILNGENDQLLPQILDLHQDIMKRI